MMGTTLITKLQGLQVFGRATKDHNNKHAQISDWASSISKIYTRDSGSALAQNTADKQTN
jgi:hypothetical protein